MKKTLLFLFFIVSVTKIFSQEKYITKSGFVSFFSHTLVEDIKAENNQVLSIIDTETGEIAIQMLMRSFQFKKELMKEHFNESYVESHKYPKATFRGFIKNIKELDEVNNKAQIEGTLTVHGKEKVISIAADVSVSKKTISIKGNFNVEVADFEIKIPAIVINNIAKIIKVNFDLNHKPYKK